jgi:hypothetical protein
VVQYLISMTSEQNEVTTMAAPATPRNLPAPARWREHAHLPVDLSALRDNIALTTPPTISAGALNVWGNSLPAVEVPGSPTSAAGVPFVISPGDGRHPDNVRAAGQLIDLPGVPAEWLHVLVTAERALEDHVHVHYQDGTVDQEWLRVSDFWPAEPRFGEELVVRTTRMHYPRHVDPRLGGQLWATRIPVVRRVAPVALRLPHDPALHLFALTVESIR